MKAPSGFVEGAFYVVVFYSIFGQNLVSVPLLGIGTLALLALMCVMTLSGRIVIILRALAWPFAFATLFVAVQLIVHGVSPLYADLRAFVTWVLGLVVVQCLSFRRGFLGRFAIAALGVGLCTIPFLTTWGSPSSLTRLGVEGAGLSNPNSLGMWFGFCAVYGLVSAFVAKHHLHRALWLVVAAGCMYMVGLTVSRGPLLGVALAAAVAFRPLLKRGFLPVLLVLALAWAFVAAGMFDGIIASYAERGAEETGRGIVWPAAFARFIEAPLFGVGVSNVFTLLPSGRNVSPHNALLWVALASGAIPALLFVVFWTRALRVALRAYLVGAADPSLLPLMVFALLKSWCSTPHSCHRGIWLSLDASRQECMSAPSSGVEPARHRDCLCLHTRESSRRQREVQCGW